jgi:organic hydroperoxide reductase OsmC/OhrA
VQVARALHIEPKNVRIRVTARYSREGSVLAGNAKTLCDSIRTELSLDSDESPERLAQLITMAEATCFTMAALRNPAPVALEATVNGQPFNPGLTGSA